MKRKALGFVLAAACAAATARAGPLDDLPLVVDAPTGPGRGLAVFISGDGGWAKIDEEISAELLTAGYGVVGLNAYRYFKDRKTPEQLAEDVARISAAYLQAWQRERLLLLGYSRGAEVLPFAVTRLSAPLRQRIDAVVLLGPATYTGFKVRLTDLIESRRHADSVDVLPEARKVDARIICVYGTDESDSLCPLLSDDATLLLLPGAHHFDGEYEALARRLLALLHAPQDAGSPR